MTTVQVNRLDPRLVGAASVTVVSPSRLAVSCRDVRKVVMLNRQTGLNVTGASADLGYLVGAMCLFSSALWCVSKEGYLLKLTTADTPALTSATNIYSATNWITSYGSVLVAPGREGGICSLNSTPAILYRLDGVLDRVAFGIASSSGYVYLFDGMGNGAVVTVHTTTGAFTFVGAFTAANCQNILGGYITGTSLRVAVKARAAVITFDISTATATVISATTNYDTSGYTLNGVLDDVTGTPLTNEVYDALGVGEWRKPSGGHYVDATEQSIIQGRTGRLVAFLPAYADYPLTALTVNGFVTNSTFIGDTLYLCGNFTSITASNGTFTRNRLAAIDLSSGQVTTWNPNANGLVRTIATDGTTLYVGGDFTQIGATGRNYIAALDASAAPTSWYPTLNALVVTIAVASGIVYVGGNFSTANAVSRVSLCSFTTGGTIQTLSLAFTAGLNQVAVSGGVLYVACSKNETISATTGAFFSLNPSTGALTAGFTVPSVSGSTSQCDGFAISAGIIYIGGAFTTFAGSTRNYFAAINQTTGALQTWNPNADSSVAVGGVTVDDGGIIYATGNFTTIGGVAQARGVAISPAGTVMTWPATAFAGTVVGITFHAGRRLLIAAAANDQFLRNEAT